MDETEFQTTVLKGVEALETKHKTIAEQQADMLSKFGNLSGETKKAFEELTRVKEQANAAAEITLALRKTIIALESERRNAFGSPLDRALANEGFGGFCNAFFRKLAMPGRKLPDHLERSLTGVDSSLGTAVVPTEYIGEIYNLLLQYGQWGTLRVMNVGARTDVLPIQTARPTYYWLGAGTGGTAESAAISEGSFTGTSVSLSIQTIATLIHVTRELLQDATVDMAPIVLRDLVQGVNYGLDFMAFAADATADQTDAGYYGIFESYTVSTRSIASAAAGNVTVATTELEDWHRCLTTVNPQVLNVGAKWWIHPTLLASAMLVRDTNKRPIFQTALETPNPRSIASLLGYPVIPVGAAPSTDAASAKIAVFGDPEGYVVGIRQQLETSTTDALKFAENMQSFRCTARAGGKHRIGASNPAATIPFAVLTLPAA